MNNPNVSYFKGSIKNTKPTKSISIGEFLNGIKHGEWQNQINQIRDCEDEDESKALKNAILPYITITGVYKERNTKGLETHSGLWAVDIDKIPDQKELSNLKARLIEDPHTFAVFVSASGKGLCVLVRISEDVNNQKDHERWIQKYYYDNFSIGVDKNALGVSRARYVSHDPNIFINPNVSKAVGKLKEKKIKSKPIQWKATGSQMDRIVEEIHNFHPLFADEYHDHVTVAFALATEYGEGGRQYYHAICMGSPKYNQREIDRKYSNAISKGNGSVSIGTFFFMCKKAGIELYTKEERDAYSLSIVAKKSKSDVKGAIQTGKAMGIDETVVRPIAEMVFDSDDISLEDSEGSLTQKLIAFVSLNYDLVFNEVTREIEQRLDGSRINDRFTSSMYVKAKLELGDKVRKSDLHDIIESDQTESVHPFKIWREENDHLPNKPEIIDEFIDILNLKDPRSKVFIRRWLLGIPSTINNETVRLVLVLVGAQKDGKTEWFRKLLPPELAKYYAESDLLHGNVSDRDILMATMLIVMDDEFGGKSKKDAQAFKAIASKDKMTFRKAYGRNNEERKRLCLLCGTTNDEQIITDATGNTRILPVHLISVYDFKKFNELDKNQLLVEIFRAYERGESWKLTEQDTAILDEASDSYSMIDVELELINKYFSIPEDDSTATFMTSTDIKVYIEKLTNQRLDKNRLGVHLNKLFEKKNKRLNGLPRKGFYVFENETTYENPYGKPQMNVNNSQDADSQGVAPY